MGWPSRQARPGWSSSSRRRCCIPERRSSRRCSTAGAASTLHDASAPPLHPSANGPSGASPSSPVPGPGSGGPSTSIPGSPRDAGHTRRCAPTRVRSTHLSLGATSSDVPTPLDQLIGRLLAEHRHHTAFSLPVIATPWLFPGLHPGRPINAAGLGARLRRLGIEPRAARRGALSHLAASMPAGVLARALDLTPNTAVRWVGSTGGDWNRYAAELVRRG